MLFGALALVGGLVWLPLGQALATVARMVVMVVRLMPCAVKVRKHDWMSRLEECAIQTVKTCRENCGVIGGAEQGGVKAKSSARSAWLRQTYKVGRETPLARLS
jgi:hypothetical protein